MTRIVNDTGRDKRTNDGTLKDTVPVAGHPYKIISPSLFNTRFVPESGRVPPLVHLPYMKMFEY